MSTQMDHLTPEGGTSSLCKCPPDSTCTSDETLFISDSSELRPSLESRLQTRAAVCVRRSAHGSCELCVIPLNALPALPLLISLRGQGVAAHHERPVKETRRRSGPAGSSSKQLLALKETHVLRLTNPSRSSARPLL